MSISAAAASAASTIDHTGTTGAKTRSPRPKKRGGYLKRNVKADSSAAPTHSPNKGRTEEDRGGRGPLDLRGGTRNGSTPTRRGTVCSKVEVSATSVRREVW